MLIFKIALVAFAYLQFGYIVIGGASWSIWKRKRQKGLRTFLLFPVSYGENIGDVGKTRIINEWSERNYRTAMALFWPVKLVSNACMIAFGGVCLGIYGAWVGLSHLISAPERAVRAITGTQVKELPPAAASDDDCIEDEGAQK